MRKILLVILLLVHVAAAAQSRKDSIHFETLVKDLGKVPEGPLVHVEFPFKNIGNEILIISRAYASSGGFGANFPKEPIMPGKTGVISAYYPTQNRIGRFTKNIFVSSNFHNEREPTTLTFKGEIFKPQGPYIYFDTLVKDFGKVPEGPLLTIDFPFRNIGNAPLVIANVQGCCSSEWSRKPIVPGETGVIKIIYYTEGKPGPCHKIAVVHSNSQTCNGNDRDIILVIKGEIIESNEPYLLFDKLEKNVGKVLEGPGIIFTFSFKNMGPKPIQIKEVSSRDGVLTAEWPKEEIARGESGIIKTVYYIQGRPGPFTKALYIRLEDKKNGSDYTYRDVLVIRGEVIKWVEPEIKNENMKH